MDELNGDWKPNWEDASQEKCFPSYDCFNGYEYDSELDYYRDSILKHAKSEKIVQAIIDSKAFRPYLDKIFSINEDYERGKK